jgi:hypothetical protein
MFVALVASSLVAEAPRDDDDMLAQVRRAVLPAMQKRGGVVRG